MGVGEYGSVWEEKGSGVKGDSQVAGEYDERAPAVFGDLMQNRHVHLLILMDGDIPETGHGHHRPTTGV